MSSLRNIGIVILGGTGAVGSNVIQHAIQSQHVTHIVSLGRSPLPATIQSNKLKHHLVDVFNTDSYKQYIINDNKLTTVVCTFGIGEPSNYSEAEMRRVDLDTVYEFAQVCKQNTNITHFELLSAVDASSNSFSSKLHVYGYYMKIKTELEQKLEQLQFQRLSLFQPSLLVTPANRYGTTQYLMLKVFPLLEWMFVGSLQRYRSIKVQDLGKAFVQNAIHTNQDQVERLTHQDYIRINNQLT